MQWWQSQIFIIITTVFSVTWSFRNHSNADLVLITSVENGAANIFVEVVIHVLMNKKYNRTAFIWYRIFFNTENVFTVNFDQLNAFLLKWTSNYLKKYCVCVCVCVCIKGICKRSVIFQCNLIVIQCVTVLVVISLIFIFCICLFYFQQATHSSMNIRRNILSLSDLQTCSLLQLNALRASLNEDIQGIFSLSNTICSHWTAATTFSVNNTTHKCHAVFMLL